MFSLIKKDFLIQKKTFLFAIFYSLFVFLMFYSPPMRESVYIMGPVAIAYLFIMNANNADDKNRVEILLNSLPIPRKNIVAAKYLAALASVVIGLSLTGIMGAVIKIVVSGSNLTNSFRFITGMDIVFAFLGVGMLISLYYPLYFKFGFSFARKINVVLFMLIFFLPGFLAGLVKGQGSSPVVQLIRAVSQNLYLWVAVTISVMIIITFASLVVSQKLYLNKEI